MIKNLCIWLVCIVIVFLISVYEQGFWLYLLAITVLLPSTLILINSSAARRVTVSLNLPNALLKTKSNKCILTAENTSFFPISRVKCVVEIFNQHTAETETATFTFSLMPRSRRNIQLNIQSEFCGRLVVSIKKLQIVDSFGFIPIPRKCDFKINGTVMPDTFNAEINIDFNQSLTYDSEHYSTEKPGRDFTETFQIREYVIGDSPKQIHWKLSQKYDKLIVRDPGLPLAKSILVFWDKINTSPEIADALAEVTVSVCQSLLDNGMNYHIAWVDGKTNLCNLHNVDIANKLYEAIPKMLGKPGNESGIESFVRLHNTADYSHVIYISDSATDEIELFKINVTALTHQSFKENY